jgi:hypothetical protein
MKMVNNTRTVIVYDYDEGKELKAAPGETFEVSDQRAKVLAAYYKGSVASLEGEVTIENPPSTPSNPGASTFLAQTAPAANSDGETTHTSDSED